MSNLANPPSDEGTTFILCDDVRTEQSGKVSLIGVYTGGDIQFLNVPSGGPAPGIPLLNLFFLYKDGEGTLRRKLTLTAPSGTKVAQVDGELTIRAGTAHADIIRIAPFVGKEAGLYTVSLDFNGHTINRTFGVKHLSQA